MPMDERHKKRFLWGMLLAWAPLVPFIPSLLQSFAHLSRNRVTGLGAVAGGLAETYLVLGIGLTLIVEAAAIVLLLGTFSSGDWLRGTISTLSIVCSLMIIFIFGSFVWLFWFHRV
jgi:hypothetical protein